MKSSMTLDRVIRKPELLEITGVSTATIYRWIGEGHFPAPIKLGPNSTGWRESAVQAWLESREPVEVRRAETQQAPRKQGP
jgi:prophage regulatory protein